MGADMDKRFLTVKEVAEETRMDDLTVRRWVKDGKLPSRRAGKRILIERVELEKFLTGGK